MRISTTAQIHLFSTVQKLVEILILVRGRGDGHFGGDGALAR